MSGASALCARLARSPTRAVHLSVSVVSTVWGEPWSNEQYFEWHGLIGVPGAIALARAFYTDTPAHEEAAAAESVLAAVENGPARGPDGQDERLSRLFSALHRWLVARCAGAAELLYRHTIATAAVADLVCHLRRSWQPIAVFQCSPANGLEDRTRDMQLRAILRNVYAMTDDKQSLDVLGIVVSVVRPHTFRVYLYRDTQKRLGEVLLASGTSRELPKLLHLLRVWCAHRTHKDYEPVRQLPVLKQLAAGVFVDAAAGTVRKLYDYRPLLAWKRLPRSLGFNLRFLPRARLLLDSVELKVRAK